MTACSCCGFDGPDARRHCAQGGACRRCLGRCGKEKNTGSRERCNRDPQTVTLLPWQREVLDTLAGASRVRTVFRKP